VGGSVGAEEVAQFKAASANLTANEPTEVVQQTLPCTPLAMAILAIMGFALYSLNSLRESV
jgi:deoxycytidylate deaminase